jgi:hypothetical protein
VVTLPYLTTLLVALNNGMIEGKGKVTPGLNTLSTTP